MMHTAENKLTTRTPGIGIIRTAWFRPGDILEKAEIRIGHTVKLRCALDTTVSIVATVDQIVDDIYTATIVGFETHGGETFDGMAPGDQIEFTERFVIGVS